MSTYGVGRWLASGVAALGLLALSADPAGVSAQPPAGPKAASDGKGEAPVSVEEARERGKLLHRVYSSTLDVMHHRYFRTDRATLPARALEDVFKDIEAETNIKARWIAVNTTAMSIHHEPETEFEKKATRQLAAGETEFEQVEDGVYQRAGVIPLKGGCVGCHAGPQSAANAKIPRFAGLVIRIPVKTK
jgi:cytochrome c553